MKKVISFLTFPMSFLTQWGGKGEQFSTSMSSATGSCCEKFDKQVMKKLAFLADENRRLKEELRLRDLYDDRNYDV